MTNTPDTAAKQAAARAGVTIRSLTEADELIEVRRLCDTVWQSAQDRPLPQTLLRALAKAGSYVAGAYDGDELVGFAIGFSGAPADDALHSHITGVTARMRGANVGFALKVHQRAWALRHGAAAITWTFDPLMRRNAYFNIGKLAATPVEYLPDFYGPIPDIINAGDTTDRLLVRWDLRAPSVAAACAGQSDHPAVTNGIVALDISATGEPVPGRTDGRTLLIAVPDTIPRLRVADPPLARRWRTAVRETLTGLMSDGARITGFDRAGRYVLTTEDA
ncbi:GNAT family N-acetyltransferase [Nocardia uniformis]|uniref:GNAT family N-acetyltransferase n=1 Tax=Nocardia uniformis TaxID=53432 RepID=A0A849CDU7_9NOCA|nr:GNAT family N-acetyltransferase [Nocardia uniformis]